MSYLELIWVAIQFIKTKQSIIKQLSTTDLLSQSYLSNLNDTLSPAMLVLYHLLSQIQLLLPRQIRVHLYLLGLVPPHPFFQSHIHLILLYSFALANFLQLFFELFRDVSSGYNFGFLFDEVGDKGRVLLEERFFEEYGFAAEDEGDCPFLFGFEDRVFDDDAVSLVEFLSKISIVAVYSPATGGNSSLTWFRFIIDNLIFGDDFFLFLLIFILLFSSFFGDICWLRQSFFEFQFANLKATHYLVCSLLQTIIKSMLIENVQKYINWGTIITLFSQFYSERRHVFIFQ